MNARARLSRRRLWQNRISPLLLLISILLLSLLLSLLTSYFVSSQQRARFERETESFDALMRRRMESYQSALASVAGLWATDENLRGEGFESYVLSSGLQARLPGTLAIGLSRWISPAESAAFERAMRAEFTDYTVRPALLSSGAPIAYIEPTTADNRSALGYDMYSNAARRAAMQRALQTAEPSMSAPLTLLPDARRRVASPAVILYLPVQRADKLYGFAFMALRIEDLMTSLLSERDPEQQIGDLKIALYDGSRQIYGQLEEHPVFQQVSRVSVAGRQWRLRYTAPETFGRDWASVLPWLVLFLGTVVAFSGYFSYLAQTIARARAEEVSESLRVSRGKLERARAEFEAIFRAMSDVAIFTDASGEVLFANDALTRHFGYLPAELRGQNLALLRQDPRLSDREAERLTTRYTRKDGSQFYGEMARNLVVSEGGTLLGYLETVHDITGRLAAERALKASEQRYQAVLEAVPAPLWVVNDAGETTYQNAQYRAYFGQVEVTSCLPPDNVAEYRRLWAEARSGLASFQREVALRTVSGERYFAVYGAPLPSMEGQQSEWVFSANDVHDRLQAEMRLRQSEQRYREVLETMPQMVWLSDPTGQPTYFNQRWHDYAGEQEDPLPLLHPNDRQEFAARWQRALNTGRLFEMEHRLLGKGGRYHTFMTRALALRSPAGEVQEWVVTSTDIDDQVYSEWSSRLLAALSKQLSADASQSAHEGSLRAALSLTNERLAALSALWQRSESGELTSLMSQARGHVREGALLSHPAVRKAAARAATYGEPVVVEDLTLQEGGVSELVLLLLAPAREEGGAGTYLALGFRQPVQVRDLEVAQEVAGRLARALENIHLQRQVKEAQEALQDLNAFLEQRVEERTTELAEANRELEAFSYSVSHDLRAPLRHILGFGDRLSKDADSTLSVKGQRYLGHITSAASRMNQLIDDLLEFSRTSRQPLSLGRVSLSALTQEVVSDLRLVMPGSAAEWHLSPLPDVLADASLLRQVLVNLLGNAAKYSSRNPQPHIWVSAEVGEREVTVRVRDNGVGFDPQYAGKLFGVFQRLHRAEDFEGSGIGLANVRRIVVRHGGRVWAESQVGEGATFFFTLRLYEAGLEG